jgi:hypothetical protein
MRKIATLALAAVASTGFAQIRFDDLTMKNAFPQWGTVMVGAHGTFREPCQLVISNYDDWCKVWPSIAGPYYQRGMQVPPFIDWSQEQIVFISLGDMGAQGYGLYVEDVRRTSNFQFDIRYAITKPNLQVGVSLGQSTYSQQSFTYGWGTVPFVAIRVPRYYGIPNFYSRYYQPPSYVIKNGCGCNHCHGHGGKVWMMGAGGVLIPYTPPGQQQGQGKG